MNNLGGNEAKVTVGTQKGVKRSVKTFHGLRQSLTRNNSLPSMGRGEPQVASFVQLQKSNSILSSEHLTVSKCTAWRAVYITHTVCREAGLRDTV